MTVCQCKIELHEQTKGNIVIETRDSKVIVVNTEVWFTRKGVVFKAVVRTPNGRFNGVTNKTKNIPAPALALFDR